jgi:hypothetical protein
MFVPFGSENNTGFPVIISSILAWYKGIIWALGRVIFIFVS